MSMLRKSLVFVCAVAGLSLAVQLAVESRSTGGAYMMASWVDRPESLEQTVELANDVVVGRVANIRPARPLRVRVEAEPDGFDEIPVEVVTLQLTDDPVKGRGSRGQNLQLFHTGHSGSPSAADQNEPRGPRPEKPEGGVEKRDAPRPDARAGAPAEFSGVIEDPGYTVGESYMLFVREGPELNVNGRRMATRGIVSPEGRWRVTRNNGVVPMSGRAWAQRMRGRSMAQLKSQAAEAVERAQERGQGQGRPGGT